MEKKIEYCRYHPAPNGKSYYIVECPFCKRLNLVFAWSGHKKCNCGAIVSTHLGVVTKEKTNNGKIN